MSTAGGDNRGGGDEFDGPTAAFRRLLKDVAGDERARVDALVALSQRTVFVATWPTDPESGIRTLTSSGGDTAMPIFSGLEVIKEAAQRFGWQNPDGSLSWRELGAREALRRAVARGVQFVVIDIGSEHSVEFARSEIEPLIAVATKKDSTGPFSVSSKVSNALIDAVRKTTRPPPPDAEAVARPVSLKPPAVPKEEAVFSSERYASAPPRSPSSNNLPAQKPSSSGRKRSWTPDPARLAGPLLDPTGMAFRAPTPVPSDEVLDLIAEALRRFPEVEWAAVATGQKESASQLLIVLRVDPAYRARLPDLNRRVRLASEDAGSAMGVVAIDDPMQMKAARNAGVVFFPWKKKAKTS